MEWESKEIEENMSLLIGLAINCVPITLGNLLNTFADMKRDYSFYGEKWYDGVSTTKENKRVYMEALCPYNNEKFRYVIHFLDANNMYEQKPCKLTDDILIYKIFRVSHKSNEKKYICLNTFYSKDDIEKYEMVVREKLGGGQ